MTEAAPGTLSAVKRGRALPLLWASYPEWVLYKSQNNLEEGLLRLSRTLVPDRVGVILLADRGFGRTEMARLCQQLKFRDLIRIKADVWIDHPSYRGLLHDYPIKKGMRRLLKQTHYCKSDPVTHNLVIRWKPDLPTKRDEPWFLMTDLEQTAVSLTELYRFLLDLHPDDWQASPPPSSPAPSAATQSPALAVSPPAAVLLPIPPGVHRPLPPSRPTSLRRWPLPSPSPFPWTDNRGRRNRRPPRPSRRRLLRSRPQPPGTPG